MTYNDRQWAARVEELFGPFYDRWIGSRGMGRWIWRFRVYAALLRAHRWCWVRGLGL